MYIQVKKIEQVKTQYGYDYKIKMVWLYEDNGKWIKWVKLDDILDELLENKIYIKRWQENT